MIVIDLHLEIFALLYILILCITLLIYKLKKKNKYNIYGLILFELYILCLVKVVYTPVRIVFNRAMSDDMVEKMKMNYANFVPFRTITGVGSVHNFAVQVGGNILLLMPLVFFLYYVCGFSIVEICVSEFWWFVFRVIDPWLWGYIFA